MSTTPFDGLTSSGYSAPRASDFLTAIREEIVDSLDGDGLPTDIDFERDVLWGILTAVMADLLGIVSEPTQDIYSQLDPNNATGIQLDGLGAVVGLTRIQATEGSVSLRLGNTTGVETIVPANSIAQGGGVDGLARWVLRDDATIPASGTVAATFDAQEAGSISAAIGEIDTIVTSVTGWNTVTNLAAATEGEDLETDQAFRQRRQESLQVTGGRSINALRANLLQVDGVQGAAVVDNDSSSSATVEGEVLQPHSIAAFIFPNSLTDAEKEEVAETIYDQVSAGIFTNGSDVVTTVVGADGFGKTIRWDWATEVAVNIAITVTVDAGFTVADVTPGIEAAVTEYMDTLSVGDDVRILPILSAVDTVDGVVTASVLINAAAVDLSITLSQISNLNILSVA